MSKPISLQQAIAGDYCCLTGYVELSRARGQTPLSCAQFYDLPPRTVYDAFRAVETGARTCQRCQDCLRPLIPEVRAHYEAERKRKKALE